MSPPVQLTISFPQGVSTHHDSLREYVQYCVHTNKTLNKIIAADMDLSPSHLSRKISANPNDTMNFTVDDLERYMTVTGDNRPLDYLNDKFNNKSKDDEIAALKAQLEEARKGLKK